MPYGRMSRRPKPGRRGYSADNGVRFDRRKGGGGGGNGSFGKRRFGPKKFGRKSFGQKRFSKGGTGPWRIGIRI